MKEERLIEANLKQKIGVYLSMNQGREITAHIIMLDWVLSEHQFVRDIHTIVNEWRDK